MSESSASHVLYLVDERPTMAFVEHWVKRAMDPAMAAPKGFDEAASEMRDLLERVATLQAAGLSCKVATTAMGVVDRVIASTPTLIILDVAGYNTQTRRLQRELKQHPETRHVPLIILTNDGRPRPRLRAAEIGCEGYLVKPALPIQLCTELRRIGVAIGTSPFTLNRRGAASAS